MLAYSLYVYMVKLEYEVALELQFRQPSLVKRTLIPDFCHLQFKYITFNLGQLEPTRKDLRYLVYVTIWWTI